SQIGETPMAIGPLEVIVIDCPGRRFSEEILPELSAVQKQGLIEVVDLLFIRKKADNTVVVLEVNDLDDEERAALDPIKDNLTGAITHEDIVRLSSPLPPETSATIVLLEHLWLGRLEQAVARAEGTVYIGGMIPPVAIEQLEQELTAARSQGQQSNG
ncbi:MAG TPA: DUF6325 family protein, partial [Ktedonobacteraceae bacterium]